MTCKFIAAFTQQFIDVNLLKNKSILNYIFPKECQNKQPEFDIWGVIQ